MQNEFIGISTLTLVYMLDGKDGAEIDWECFIEIFKMIKARGWSYKTKRFGCYDGLSGYLHALLIIQSKLAKKLDKLADKPKIRLNKNIIKQVKELVTAV